MYTQAVNIAVVEGKTIISTTELRSDPQGKPVVIKAIPNGKYILAEGENGFAPENITIKRVGKNLHIALEGTDPDQPQVIIEGFFDNQGQLVGVAEDGNYHEYICSDADQDHSAAFLMDGESSPQVLGADKLSGFDGLIAGSGIGWFWPALLGLAGLAGLAIAAGRDHGDGDDYPLATPRLDSVTDNIGSKTGPLKSGDATDDTTPTFNGSGTPGNTILIKDGDKVIGTTIVNESGNWEFTPTPPLSEGKYQISFTEKNPEGTESAPTPPFELTIDITPPGNGGIDLVIDNAGLVTGSIANGGTTDDTTPTLSGGGQTPGDTVTIIDNGEPLATVIVAPDGTWTYTPPPLNEGEHPFTLIVTDPAGNASDPSDPYTIIVDTTAPAAPVITGVLDDQAGITGNISSGGLTNDARPTISGTGEPGATVEVSSNGVPLGTALVNASGQWTLPVTADLPENLNTLTAKATDTAGNASPTSTPYPITVDTTAPATPAITGVLDDQAGITGNISSGGLTNDARPTISGTGEPGATVEVSSNGVPLGTALVNASGQWTLPVTADLPENLNTLTAKATDTAGNASPASTPYPITVDTTAPAAPAITGVLDDQGTIKGNILSGGTTDDTKPIISGTGEPGATVEIFSNGTPLGTALVNASGQWALALTTDLPENLNTLTAIATDTSGNASPTSTPYPITVDTTAPAAPAITGVLDDQGTVTGNILSGGTTDDTKPTISGTGEPGTTVEVSSNGVPLGTALVNASGQWTLPVTADLPEDLNTLTAIATDTAGNASPASTPYPITVDTTAPAAPAITGVLDDQGSITGNILSGGTTDDTKPIISGTGEPGATVEIFSNGTPLGTALVNASGQWALALTTDLPENLNTLTAIATDTADNVSPPSATYAITVDTLSPVASATIDSMSKDSGTNHSNFITNDGSAGRVIQGSLTSALAAGEKVQVSVDGGVTWLDPTVTGTKWSALDLGSHNANWEIQTRVLDLAGHTNVSSQSVTLDTTVPSPTSVSWDGFNIVVNFNPAGVAVGDKIHLIIDGNSVEHSLTNGDITAGQAQLPWSSSVHGNSNSIDAAIVDSTGNVSTYLPYVKSTAISILETFDSQPQISLVTGQDYAMNGFKLTAVATSSGGNGSTGFGTALGLWAEPPSSRALIMTGGSNIKLTMNSGETYNSISFRVGDFNNVESFEARFYDASGTLVYTTTTTPEASGLGFTVTKELPLGLNFSSVTLVSSGSVSNAFWIDNIQLETTQYIEGTLHDPLTNQTITQSGEFYGAETNNTFFIDSVALLDPAGSGIHGGGGIDTLKLTGQNQVLDLTNLGQKLESIEVIDLTGTGNNTLKLSLTDVLEQGGTSLFTNDGHMQMMVKGNAGDAVILDDLLVNGTDPGNWANSGQVSVSGVVYDVYRHDTLDAELLVQQGVTTTLV